jgi:hypothetical protein
MTTSNNPAEDALFEVMLGLFEQGLDLAASAGRSQCVEELRLIAEDLAHLSAAAEILQRRARTDD